METLCPLKNVGWKLPCSTTDATCVFNIKVAMNHDECLLQLALKKYLGLDYSTPIRKLLTGER